MPALADREALALLDGDRGDHLPHLLLPRFAEQALEGAISEFRAGNGSLTQQTAIRSNAGCIACDLGGTDVIFEDAINRNINAAQEEARNRRNLRDILPCGEAGPRFASLSLDPGATVASLIGSLIERRRNVVSASEKLRQLFFYGNLSDSVINRGLTYNDGKADRFIEYIPDIDSPRGGHLVGGVFYVIHPPYLSSFVDKDGDLTLPGAIKDGMEVVISAYQHQSHYGALPVGNPDDFAAPRGPGAVYLDPAKDRRG